MARTRMTACARLWSTTRCGSSACRGAIISAVTMRPLPSASFRRRPADEARGASGPGAFRVEAPGSAAGGMAQGATQLPQVAPPGPGLRPETGQMGRLDLAVDQMNSPAIELLHEGDEGHLRSIAFPGEHRLAEESGAQRHAVQAPGQLLSEPRLRGVREAQLVQPRV